MSFWREHLFIFKHTGWLAVFALAIGSLNDQLLSQQLEALLASAEGVGWTLFLLGFLSLLNGLLFPILALILLLFGVAKFRGYDRSLPEFLGRIANPVYIETVRSWGAALAWGLLLILPGLLRLVQLIYVPFIVIFLKAYSEGQTDALKRSTRYFLKRPWSLTGYMLIFVVLLPFTLTAWLDPWRSYLNQPFTAFLCTLVDLVLLVLSTQVLYRLFDKIRRELNDESLLSMARHPTPQ